MQPVTQPDVVSKLGAWGVGGCRYTHPLEHTPGSSGGHYGKDAETYMNIGEAMGKAMVGLLKGSK